MSAVALENAAASSGSGLEGSNLLGDEPEENGKRTIHLLTLLPYYNPIPALNPSWDSGDDLYPALELAKDQINNSTSILPNYTLELDHGKGGCDVVIETARGFTNGLYSPSDYHYIGILGPACSSSIVFVGQLTARPEISLVVLHGGGASILSNRTRFPHLLGTLGNSEQFVSSFDILSKKTGWKRVAVLYDDARLFYLDAKRLLQKSFADHIEFLSSASFTFLPLNAIRNDFLRIVFVLCPLELTRRIMCLAKKAGMVYEDFQFVILGHTYEVTLRPVDFTYNRQRYYCRQEEMAAALDHAIFLNHHLVPNDDVPLISNTDYSEFEELYKSYRDVYNQQPFGERNSTFNDFATTLYDSLWAWALVLDNLTKSNEDFDVNSNYGNVAQRDQILEQFYKTSFEGMSGKVTFRRNDGYTPRQIDVFQAYDNASHFVASIDSDGSLSVPPKKAIFVINDSFDTVILRENESLASFFNFVTVILTLMVMIIHVVTIAHHKTPSIKATSLKLHHMSYVGVYILLAGIFTWTLYSAAAIDVNKRHYFCHLLWAWCLPVGFTLTFGSIAMRTWRIYRIFKHYLNPGPFISDSFLIGSVAMLLVLDLILGVTWTIVDPFTLRQVIVLSRDENSHTSSLVVRLDCYCEHLAVWTGVLFAYKLTVVFAVTIFAYLTRHIFNTSFATTFLRVMVFLMAIILPLGFSVYAIIIFMDVDDSQSYFSFSTLCVTLQLIALLSIMCIFMPPLAPIFKKYTPKKGDKQRIIKIADSESSK